VLDEDQRQIVGQVADQLGDEGPLGRRQAGRRLVEQEQRGRLASASASSSWRCSPCESSLARVVPAVGQLHTLDRLVDALGKLAGHADRAPRP
jgi:hypothetical protein